jgi:hypothetical protein
MEEDLSLVSGPLRRYYRLFQILDPVWCFLVKNRTPCTIENLKKMVRCDGLFGNERRQENGTTDLKEILQQLEIICDSFLILTPSPQEDPHMEQAILSYSKFNGISKVSHPFLPFVPECFSGRVTKRKDCVTSKPHWWITAKDFTNYFSFRI